jgi:hypothetical protein
VCIHLFGTCIRLGYEVDLGIGVLLPAREFLFTTSRVAPGPTHPVHLVRRDVSPEVKRPGHEAGYSLLSSTKVMSAWSHSFPHFLHTFS